MLKNWKKDVISNVMVPLGRIIRVERMSENYNYLPQAGKESIDYAWAFYCNIFESVKEYLDAENRIPGSLKESLYELMGEARHFVINYGNYDYIPRKWLRKNPNLYFQTTRSALYSDLKSEGAYEMMEKMGFDEYDELADIDRMAYEKESGLEITDELFDTYVEIATDLMSPYMSKDEAVRLLKKEISETRLRASKDEMEQAKRTNEAPKQDIAGRHLEAKRRLEALYKGLGDFKEIAPFQKYEKQINALEKEHHFTVYHVADNDDETLYLGVFPEYLFWEELRMENAANCYVEKKGSPDEFGFEVVSLKCDDDGRLVRGF